MEKYSNQTDDKKKLTKDADEADALGEVDVGPEGKSCDDEDGDAGDAGGQQHRLGGVEDGDDPDYDAVEGSQHPQQDDVERIPPAHLRISSKVTFHNFHLDVAAGHGQDNGQDGDVEQHGEDEPAFAIGPHLENQITNPVWVHTVYQVTHSVPEAEHEDGGDEGGDEQAPCHQQVDLPGGANYSKL